MPRCCHLNLIEASLNPKNDLRRLVSRRAHTRKKGGRIRMMLEILSG
jgi:hypothetical protein